MEPNEKIRVPGLVKLLVQDAALSLGSEESLRIKRAGNFPKNEYQLFGAGNFPEISTTNLGQEV